MKLLLIMPRFFSYPEMISNELEKIGYEVDFFDDRPSTNAWIKALLRINKKLVNKMIHDYFENIMNTIGDKQYDVVLLISGQSLSFSEKMIQNLKKKQNKARFILYQWDSQKNFPYIINFQKYFDKCYTFDKNDAETTEGIEFFPLFYGKEYEKIGNQHTTDFEYDFCFVGTAHPKKYMFIKKMSEQLKGIFSKQYIYFFFPSPIVFFYRKIFSKELRGAKYKEFHFTPLSSLEMNDVYMKSRCVMDSSQEGQIGLTIRAIEALGAKKKLITTNPDIKNYDFYKPENIYVYDGSIDLSDTFFVNEYADIEQETYEKYSLRNWLKHIIEE